jgi:hypothetical protein
LSVHTWRIAVARRTGKTLQSHEQAKDAASTSAPGTLQSPYAGVYLQLSGGSRDGNSAAVISRPSLSILTRHMYSTTDDPCQVLKIATLHNSTVVRSHRLQIGDLQASSVLPKASCLLMRHECVIVPPTGLVLADGTEHGNHNRSNVDTSNTVDDCTAVLHRVTLISLARARALQLCTKPGNAGNVLNEHLRLATIGRFPRSCRLECSHIRSQARRRPPCLPQSSFSEIIIMHTTSDRYVHTHDIEPVTVMGAAQAQS